MDFTRNHVLKIRPQYIEWLTLEEKRVEIRQNDRDYQRGDTIHFINAETQERVDGVYRITHVLADFEEGIVPGYAALSIAKIQ